MHPKAGERANDACVGSLHRRLGLAMGLAAGLAVILTLGDPGLTVDEPLDVRPGRTYVAELRAQGWRFFDRAVVERVFRDNAEHPPLGRWLLGIASTLGEPFEIQWRGPDPTGLYVLSGRLAPALAFAVLVGVVAAESARRWGRAAGLAAGWSLLAMPRVFRTRPSRGSRHVPEPLLDPGSADECQGHAVTATLRSPRPRRGPSGLWPCSPRSTPGCSCRSWRSGHLRTCPGEGPPRPSRSGRRSGVGLFFLGWPWLWYDTWARWQAYWGTSLTRATIMVEYFGRIMPDRDVPWHYPWFYFAVTVPVGLQLLGIFGLVLGWKDRRLDAFPCLLAGSIGRLPGRLQHADTGVRRRAAVPARLPRLGDADRAGFRPTVEPRELWPRSLACCWRDCCWLKDTAPWLCILSGSATTISWSEDCPGPSGWGSS